MQILEAPITTNQEIVGVHKESSTKESVSEETVSSNHITTVSNMPNVSFNLFLYIFSR